MSALPKLIIGLVISSVAAVAAAQQYPTHSVNMIVPYAAGGPTDTVARVVAQAMLKPMGQTVIVENRPSAGGIIGPEAVKNAKPDGYTILIHHIGMA
jgi:tripartite-type tricarboxylate transporter receptor subunit TctC